MTKQEGYSGVFVIIACMVTAQCGYESGVTDTEEKCHVEKAADTDQGFSAQEKAGDKGVPSAGETGQKAKGKTP